MADMPAQRYRRLLLRRPRRVPAHHFAPDPEQADQANLSRREMRVFDQLPAEARRAIAETKFGVHVAETILEINRYGVSDGAKRLLKEKGLTPSDVGAEGVLLEEMKIMERDESQRLAAEIERRVVPRSTHAELGILPTFRIGRRAF